MFEKYPNFKHQNIAAEIGVIKNSILKEDISHCKNLIILDDVKDINNIGSIIRSVSAFNFDGIIVEKRNLNLKNPAIYKTSVGEIENIKLFQVSNISNAIEILKKNNFWIYGMDINGEELLNNFSNFNEKKAIIFGSEENGISRNVLKNCDYKIRINMSKKVESLNISNVAAITLAYFFNLKK